MVTNPKAKELEVQGKVEYDNFTLWPHYHKEKMNWASGIRTRANTEIIVIATTGRDPFEDVPCRNPEDERAGKGKLVGNIKEQTRQVLWDIKEALEMMGASMKDIFLFHYFLPRREDVFDFRDEMYRFFEEFEPDLRNNPRMSVLLRGVGLDLKEMYIEIEVWAVVPSRQS